MMHISFDLSWLQTADIILLFIWLVIQLLRELIAFLTGMTRRSGNGG